MSMDGAALLAAISFAVQIAAGVAPMKWPQHAWLAGLIFWTSCVFAILCLIWFLITNYSSILEIFNMTRPWIGWVFVGLSLVLFVGGMTIVAAGRPAVALPPASPATAAQQSPKNGGEQIPAEQPISPEEQARRAQIFSLIRGEYFAGAAVAVGNPPPEYTNKRLAELGETWRVPHTSPKRIGNIGFWNSNVKGGSINFSNVDGGFVFGSVVRGPGAQINADNSKNISIMHSDVNAPKEDGAK